MPFVTHGVGIDCRALHQFDLTDARANRIKAGKRLATLPSAREQVPDLRQLLHAEASAILLETAFIWVPQVLRRRIRPDPDGAAFSGCRDFNCRSIWASPDPACESINPFYRNNCWHCHMHSRLSTCGAGTRTPRPRQCKADRPR